jgi:hypothetical protein
LGDLERQKLREHRFPRQRVAERERRQVATPRAGDQLRPGRGAKRREDFGVPDPRDSPEQPPVEGPAKHRSRKQHAPRRIVQGRKPTAHQIPVGRRQVVGHAAGQAPLGSQGGSSSRSNVGAQHLLDQERDSLRPSAEGAEHRSGKLVRAEGQAGHGGHLVLGEGSERDADRGPASGHAGEDLGGWSGRVRTLGDETQHPLRPQLVGNVIEEGQRVGVRPVRVLNHEQETGIGREVPEQAKRGLRQQQARLGGGNPCPPQRQQVSKRGPVRLQLGIHRRSGGCRSGVQRINERTMRR